MNAKKEKQILDAIKKEYRISGHGLLRDALRYVNAIKQNRIICVIDSVSQSGTSRTMKFYECVRAKGIKPTRYNYRNFYSFFKELGYTPVKNNDTFRIVGCGMDMVFDTHYNILYSIKKLGIITQKTFNELSNETPLAV